MHLLPTRLMTSLPRLLSTLGCLAAGAGLMAFQAPAPDCRQQILTAYHKLTRTDLAKQGVYHLRFSNTTRYKALDQRTPRMATVHGEFYSQGRRGYFQTEQFSLWQDGQYVVTVLRNQHTILVARMVPGKTAADPSRLLGIRDSLLQLGTVQQCRAEPNGKQLRQHVQLVYNGAVGARLHLRQLDFWVTPLQELQQLRVQYRPGATIEESTLQFLQQEWLPGSDKLPLDARSKVLAPNGELLPQFAGYQLVNQVKPRA
jgi:hypothetical protein